MLKSIESLHNPERISKNVKNVQHQIRLKEKFVSNLVLPDLCYRPPLIWFYDLSFNRQFQSVMGEICT